MVRRAEGLTAAALIEEADAWLGGLEHRKVELEEDDAGAAIAAGLREAGWVVERLVTMHRPGAAGTPEGPPAAELGAAETDALSVEWLLEEEVMPDEGSIRAYLADAAAGEARRAGELVAVGTAGVGFVSVRLEEQDAEIEHAYVTAAARGRGIGTSLLRGAMARAGTRELWIVADADGRSRELYARLGFEPVWTYWDCTRRPPAKSDAPRR